MSAIIFIFRTASSILYIGGLVMTGIGGWYDYQQTLVTPEGPFGLSILLWGIIIAGIGSLLLVSQMWYRIWQLENPKVKMEVYPHFPASNELKLFVHNKANVPVSISANMTCESISDYDTGGRALSLLNAPMGWESSGTYRKEVDPDAQEILKLCSLEIDELTDRKVYWMSFYKIDSDELKKVRFMGHESELVVEVTICLNANIAIKGKREWKFKISLLSTSETLVITPTVDYEVSSLYSRLSELISLRSVSRNR